MADPFYNQIIDRLSKHLDPLVFEACVMDILREVYPGLVPIPGGGDSGRDGLIADESDQPFPLVATTSLDVIGNVRNNLESYLAAGGPRRVVVVATSQSLTPTRRDRIVGAAHDQGFTVKQIHAQDDLANRLYHSPRWCRELLGLAGQPPALSRLPAQNRRWLDLGLIGRDAELKSLVDSKADQIVVGQPGTGKSYLLHHFALTGLGLFVISRDLDRVIDGIRSQDPPSLILDDAGNKLELLEELVHFRREIEGSFRIIASCWPGQEAEISRRLTDPMTIEVGLFNRDELLYLLTERMHIRASVEVVTALITQAAGRPGIAVVLGQMWEGGHWEKALSGDLLMEEVLRFTSDTTHVKGVLACFALGGEVGMILDVVSKIYQLRPLEIQEILTRLSVGGIIEVESNNLVKVRIEPLRYALVKDVFFGKNPVSSALRDQLIAEAPNKSECIRTLIGARARGGMVPDQLIRTEIEQLSYFSRGRILALYAQLGREEAIWAWEMDNTLAFEHAAPFLNFIPDILLPHLFDSCLEDQRPTALHPDTPMSQIQKWVSGLETPAEFIRRRQLLMDRAFRWGEQVDHQQVLERLFCIVLSPRLEWYKPHPGEGYKWFLALQCG